MKTVIKRGFILLCLIPVLTCTACSNNEADDKKIDMSALRQSMLEADSGLPDMSCITSEDENAAENLVYLADNLNYDMVDSYFYTYSSTGTAHEIAVICAANPEDVSAIKQCLEAHLESREHTFQYYAPEQVAAAQNAIVISSGNYVAMIMCDNQDAVKNVFLDMTQ